MRYPFTKEKRIKQAQKYHAMHHKPRIT
jgi:hypothetical protein